jgi:hypothetical protein
MNFLKMMANPGGGGGTSSAGTQASQLSQNQNNPMQAAYAELEVAKNFYYQRKREIEEVMGLLQERVEAEKAYA